jgi:hypothetical protein
MWTERAKSLRFSISVHAFLYPNTVSQLSLHGLTKLYTSRKQTNNLHDVILKLIFLLV